MIFLKISFVLTFVQDVVDANFGYPRVVPLAAVHLQDGEDRIMEILRFAKDKQNVNDSESPQFPFFLSLEHKILDNVKEQDAWSVTEAVCQLSKNGFLVLMAGANYATHAAYASVANLLHIPFVNWMLPSDNVLNQFEISMQLPLHKVLGDYLIAKNWYTIIYMYYGEDDLLNLARLTQYFYKKRRVLLTFHLMQLPRKDSDYDEFFEKFHEKKSNSLETQVVVDVHNSTKMALILKVLKRQKLLKPDRKREFKKYHYVLGFFMSKNDLAMESLKGDATNFINITVLQLFSPTNEVYEHLLTSLSTDEAIKQNFADLNDLIVPEAAFAYDGLLVINTALAGRKFKKSEKSGSNNNDFTDDLFPKSMFRKEKMYNGGYRGVYCIPSDDTLHPERPFLPLANGKKIAARLRQVQIRGLTGDIEFDENGFRKNFYVHLIELEYMGIPGTSGAVSSITNFVWKDQIGLLTNKARVSYERTRAKVMRSFNRKLNITTALGRPFVMLKDNHEKLPAKDKYEGYAMDLINLLSKKIENFDYDIVLSPDGKFGSEKKDGTWDGMIGELMAGRADMAVASLTITRARQQVVDFSKPFLSTGLSIMIRKPAASEFTIFSFMHPLSNEVWMYIIFAYIGISVVLFLVSRFSPYEWRVEEACQGTFTISNDFSVYNCLWFTLSAFMQQGIDILPRSVSGRIASSAWWFFTMIIVSSYTANLAAFLTLEKMSTPIESAEDLAKQTKIKYGIQANGSTELFFKESTVQLHERMYLFMTSQPQPVMVSTYDEGIEKVRASKSGRYAFILEATTNDYINSRPPCNTMKVGSQNLNSVGFGVATPFGSDLRARINLAILELQETGELNKLEKKWWYEKGGKQCDKLAVASKDGQSSLTQGKVAGIFYILIAGVIVAVIIALGEFVYRSRLEARKTNQTFSRSLRSNLNLTLHGHKERDILPATNTLGIPPS